MAHILSGDWSSFTINSDGDLDEDDDIHLDIDEGTGDIKSGSHQNGHKLRGKATRAGNHYVIQIINDEDRRTYDGILFPEPIFGGQEKRRVVNGRVRLDFVPPLDALTDEGGEYKPKEQSESKRFFDQEQAIWVGSKPA